MENKSLVQQREEDELRRLASGQTFNYRFHKLQILNWKVMIGIIRFFIFSVYGFGISYSLDKIIMPLYKGLFVNKESFSSLMGLVGIDALAVFIGVMIYFYLVRDLIKDYEKYVRKQIKMHQFMKAEAEKKVIDIICSKPKPEAEQEPATVEL